MRRLAGETACGGKAARACLCLLAAGPAFLGGVRSCHAEVKLPAIFGDHMVLQQDGKIPVWGTATPGENVTVALGTDTARTQTAADSTWRVDLAALPTTGTAQTLTVVGSNTLSFRDVLVGDVWLAGGQSNMEFKMVLGPGNGQGDLHASEALAKADHPPLRYFAVEHQKALRPKTDVKGKWVIATPETVKQFSAVAYYFGVDLQQSLNRPIGLIVSCWGGTPAQSWATLETMKTIPQLAGAVKGVESEISHAPKDPAAIAAADADYEARKKAWDDTVNAPFQAALNQWSLDRNAAIAAHQPVPPMPRRGGAPSPISPEGEEHQPAVLYNGMIAPLIPFGIKGVIWYQGESNVGHWDSYGQIFPAVITDWRAKWGEGNFPFLFVQLANFQDRLPEPGDSANAQVRDVQLKALSLPNTGMAVAIDLGLAKNIHPRDKLDVGKRLALAARHVAYGQNLVYSGPTYDHMAIAGNQATLSFGNVGSGLIIGAPPVFPTDSPLPSTTELQGFAVAGQDKKWGWAHAEIRGNTVVISSDAVPTPVAVRYGWADNPVTNLYNKENLPASPFRTDSWDMPVSK